MILRLEQLSSGASALSWTAWILLVLALAAFLLCGSRLARIDATSHRLPDRIVLPFGIVALLLLVGSSVLEALDGAPGPAGADTPQLFGIPGAQVVAGGLLGGLFYLALRVLYPAGLGFGDVKLAAVLGLYLGYLGLWPLVLGTVLAFVLGGLTAGVLLLRGRMAREDAIAFGPFMLLGAALAMMLPAG